MGMEERSERIDGRGKFSGLAASYSGELSSTTSEVYEENKKQAKVKASFIFNQIERKTFIRMDKGVLQVNNGTVSSSEIKITEIEGINLIHFTHRGTKGAVYKGRMSGPQVRE